MRWPTPSWSPRPAAAARSSISFRRGPSPTPSRGWPTSAPAGTTVSPHSATTSPRWRGADTDPSGRLFESDTISGKEEDSRPSDTHGLCVGKVGPGNYQTNPTARCDENQVDAVRADIPGTVTWAQATAHHQADPPADRTPVNSEHRNCEAET